MKWNQKLKKDLEKVYKNNLATDIIVIHFKFNGL